MIDSNQIARRLWEDEGFVPHVYRDNTPAGYWTIGVGILVDERRGGGITAEEGMFLLRNRIIRTDNLCRARFPWFARLDTVRQQVIICMAYQLGVNGVANFKRMLAAIERSNFVEAAQQMLDSKWARDDSPARAKRMANMMERGEWIEPSTPIT